MPLLPSALPPKWEAKRYVANDFLNLNSITLEGKAKYTQRRFYIFMCRTTTLNPEP